MWIKNMYGAYINMDNVVCLFYMEKADRTICDTRNGDRFHCCDGNRCEEIIRNIILGKKLMEVL